MGGAVSVSNNNDDMVTKLVNADYIKTRSVEQAFRAVDRGNYVLQKDSAYSDTAWKTEHVHVSAPCIYAQVLEGLFLQPGQSFLNIGSGTGYLSTMVAMIIGREGSNHGVELRADVIKYALVRLKHFKTTPAYNRHHFADPVFVEGDAFHLHPPKNKYDRIYCGAAVPLSYLDMLRDDFLNVGGVVVAPVEDELLQVYKESPNRDICTSLLDVSFLHLIRRGRGAAGSRPDGADDGITLPCHHVRSLLEQCRSLIVRRVRGRLMREKTTRGGIFALCFTSENCPSVPEPPRRRPGFKCPRSKMDEKKYGGFSDWGTGIQQRRANYRSGVELPLVTEGDGDEWSYNRVPGDVFLDLGTSNTSQTVDVDEAGEATEQKASSSRDSGCAASLPTNSHSKAEEPLTSCPFLNREASVLGYRDDGKVIRVCGRTLLETHSSHFPKKDNELINKHPPYMLRNSYQATEEDSMDSMDLFGLNHNDTDEEAHARNQPTNTLGHSVRSLISLNDDVLSDSSSDSTLSSEEKPGKDDSDQEIDLPRSVMQQRKVKSFNARVRARQNQGCSSTSSYSGADAPPTSVFTSLPIETKSFSETENSLNSIAEKRDSATDDSTNFQKLDEIAEENVSLASCSLLKFSEADHIMEVDEAEVNTSNVPIVTSAPNYFQSDNNDVSVKGRSYLKRSSSEDDDMASDNSRSGLSSHEENVKDFSGSRRKKAIKRQTGAGPKEKSSRCRRSAAQEVATAVEPSSSATGATTNESCSALDASASGVVGDEAAHDSDGDSSNDGLPQNTGATQPSDWENRNVTGDLLHVGIQRFPNNFEEDGNMSREINRRSSHRVSMISLLRLAYSHVGDSDRRNDGLLNEEDDLSSDNEVDDDGDDDDDADEEVANKKLMKDTCDGERTQLHGACAFNWFRFPMSEAELSSSDEEPEYFKKSLSGLDYSSDNDFGKKKSKKKKSKLWVKGTDGFDLYIDSKHSKLLFRKLPKETRFEIRTQTRLFCLPLPQRILDYLLYGSSLQALP